MKTIFSKRNVIILTLLWLITNLLFHFGPWSTSALAEVSGSSKIPDIMFSYNLETLQNLFATYGPEGITIYKNFQLIDFVYPLIYGALLLGLLVRVKISPNFNAAYAWPFTAVFFDYSENFIIRYLINLYPNITEAQDKLVKLASICTNLKWTFIMLSILNIIGFWIWNLLKKK